MIINLQEHTNDVLNQAYRVINIKHQTGQGNNSNYNNELTLIPANRIYRTIDKNKEGIERYQQTRQFNHIFSAKVESNSEDYAQLDEQERYKLHLILGYSDCAICFEIESR